MERPNKEHSEQGRSGLLLFRVVAALILLLVLLVLYVLSIGPVAWLVGHKFIPESPAIDTFYSPLDWLAVQLPLFSRFLEWYLGLFVEAQVIN